MEPDIKFHNQMLENWILQYVKNMIKSDSSQKSRLI